MEAADCRNDRLPLNLRVMRRTIMDRSGLTETVATTELLHELEADDDDSDTQNQKDQVMKRDCVGKHTGSVASASTQERPVRNPFKGGGPVWGQGGGMESLTRRRALTAQEERANAEREDEQVAARWNY